MINIYVISLFPEMFRPIFDTSMLRKAQEQKIVSFHCVNLRDFGIGPRQTVDDTPFGGGDGMLLKPEPLFGAVEYCLKQAPGAEVVLMTPRGQRFTQQHAHSFSSSKRDLIFICGRYEGYDERIVTLVDSQISIGDFVVTGGEIPAMLVIDAVVRLIPGVLGGSESAHIESFSEDMTYEFPQYTRPANYKGVQVPDVLLSGNHAAIQKWREEQSHQQLQQKGNSG